MKLYINSIKTLSFSVMAVAFFMMTGCSDGEYNVLDTHAYIEEALSNTGVKVTVDAHGESYAKLNVHLSDLTSGDNHYKLVPDQSVLDNYNTVNGTSYIMLPKEQYILPEDIVVKSGQYASEEISVTLKAFSQEMMKSGESYALPVKLVAQNGSTPVMATTGTFVLLAESIVEFSAPMFTGAADLVAKAFQDAPETYNQYTIEVRFQVSNTENRNRAIFSASDNSADPKKSILLRFEDPQSTNENYQAHSLVQIQLHKGYVNPTKAFETNKWQHLAVTFDGARYRIYVNGVDSGVLEASSAMTTFKNVSWFSGSAWWSGCKILMSEARIWSVCRSAIQIQNNMTQVRPSSDGLEAYWRFNEGSGNVFNDATGKGHTLTTSATPTWVNGILSTDTSTAWPK